MPFVIKGSFQTFYDISVKHNYYLFELVRLAYYPRPNVPFGTGGHCTTRPKGRQIYYKIAKSPKG